MNFNFFYKLAVGFLFILSISFGDSHSYADPLSIMDTPTKPSPKELYFALIDAAEAKDFDKFKILIGIGADIYPQEEYAYAHMRPLLHYAVGSLEITNFLIEKGADVNERDFKGNTALHNVTADPEVVKALVAAGADPNAQNNDGINPLHHTTHPEIVKLLIEAGADIEARANGLRPTPLQLAINRGNIEVATVLIEAGADIEARDSADQTPLFYARDTASINLLREADADIEARDHLGETPVFHFVFPEVVRALVSQGADVHAISNSGQTPIGNARRAVSSFSIITDAYIKDKEILNILNGIDPVFVKCESALLRAAARILSAY